MFLPVEIDKAKEYRKCTGGVGEAMVRRDAGEGATAFLIVDSVGTVVAYSGAWEQVAGEGECPLEIGAPSCGGLILDPPTAVCDAVRESLAKRAPVWFSARGRDNSGRPLPIRGLAAPLRAPHKVSEPEAAPLTALAQSHSCPKGSETGLAVVLLRPEDTADSVELEDRQAELRQRIGEIAHELNRPLAAVMNYAELALAHPELPPAVRARLEMVIKSAEACRHIVQHSLEIATSARVAAEWVDLNRVVQRAIASLSHIPGLSNIELSLRLDPDLPPIFGSRRDLESAVRNLLENAVEAVSGTSPKGGRPKVEVTTERSGSGVRLSVRDNGPGIDSSVAHDIFEPFVSTKRSKGGAGLGLTIVRRIVQQHEGRVAAASAPGGGSVFTVELPTKEPSPTVSHQNAQEVFGGTHGRNHVRPRRALLIDDDVSTRKLLGAYLRTLGYESTEVADGGEGLAKAATEEYDVIICDVKMPSMTGIEFHHLLEKVCPDRAARVIFSTGVLSSDPVDAELRELPNACLRKPYRLAALKAALEAVDRKV